MNDITKTWIKHSIIIILAIASSVLVLVVRGKQAVNGILNNYHMPGINDQKIIISQTPVNFGIYDPDGEFSSAEYVAINHYFISWLHWEPQNIQQLFKKAESENRWILLTVEPHPFSAGSSILQPIIDGKYDQIINELCSTLESTGQPTIIRWGHEMENVTGRYPWAIEDSQSYISAYQHFVTTCRQQYTQGYYIWSPVGHQNLTNYWPGTEYVDNIGISLFAFKEWEQDYFGRVRSFQEILNERYNRIKKYNKPVIITEMGINGEPKYQQQWLSNGFKHLTTQQYPLLKTLIYFNSGDKPEAWGPDYPIPDWHIDPDIFE